MREQEWRTKLKLTWNLDDKCRVCGAPLICCTDLSHQRATWQEYKYPEYKPGDPIPYAGRVFGQGEKDAAHRAVDAFWLTEGPECAAFERELAAKVGCKKAILCNSGSSANLLAISALDLQPGDEVITCALGFPTTAAPIIQCGATAVFVDCEADTLVPNWDRVRDAVTGKTRAVVLANTLGNPIGLRFSSLGGNGPIVFIEDNCDALGGTHCGQQCGTFGTLATQSFYPAHHITTGEGGAVLINNSPFAKKVRAFRDWGRDCWCATGKSDTCGTRFKGPYDHKYTYSELGYNLKMGDIAAAIGREQLKKLDDFTAARRRNWQFLADNLPFEHQQPTPNSIPSWFAFAFRHPRRNELARHLEANGIGCRMPLGGNLTRQPAFKKCKDRWRIHGDLANANRVMDEWLFIGCYPGLNEAHLERMIQTIRLF